MTWTVEKGITYATQLAYQARKSDLPDFCGPVAIAPFCRSPSSFYDLHDLVRQHDCEFFGFNHMIARAKLSLIGELEIDPYKDADFIAYTINHPREIIRNNFPELLHCPVRGLLISVGHLNSNEGHTFSVIPADFLSRDFRRELNKLRACLLVDINLDAVVNSIENLGIADYTKVYFEEFDYETAFLGFLTDKKLAIN